MIESGPEAEAGDAGLGQQPDELPLALGVLEADPGRQQELPALKPRGRVEQLRDVDPADLGLARNLPSGGDL